MLSYPVVAADGQLIGVVCAALDIQWLNRFKFGIEANLPGGSTIAQVDEQGVILAHQPDPGIWVGRSLTQTALIEALHSVSKGMITLPGPDGQPWFYAISQLHSTLRNQKVHFLLGVPQHAVFQEANRLLVHNLTLLGAMTFLILVAAWLGIDLFVLRQVKAMLAATRKLTAGDLSVRTGILRRTGELNELAKAFDDMAGALEYRETQRQKAEQDLRNSHEQLRNLSSHLESVREEERTRLAREIHDELGQALTALKMDIAWLNRRLDPEQEPLHEKTRSMGDLIDATIRTVQRLSGELRPGLLDDLGLAAAIEWQAEEFQKRAGIACDVRLNLGETTLSRDHATAIFRIFQETLTNVLRHARATQVSVLLQAQDNQLILEVVDNGRGITEEEIRGVRAFGLIGMRERVLTLKGQILIDGRPGRGTTITITVPLINGENSS
jgi:signal transduction histidine kinase